MLYSWESEEETADYRLAAATVNREYFVSKIFHAINFHIKQFSDKRLCTALLLILCMYMYFMYLKKFHAFNFCTSQAVRKYFNNEILMIYSNSEYRRIPRLCPPFMHARIGQKWGGGLYADPYISV